jgi:chromate transporter
MTPLSLDVWSILQLTLQYWMLSLLTVGGPVTTIADQHRYLVREQGWITDTQFSASIALSQAAPGPNVIYVALLGWHVGLNASQALLLPAWTSQVVAIAMALLCLVSILLPSGLLTYHATRWAQHHQHLRMVKAFKTGMAPLVIALLFSSGWLLAAAHSPLQEPLALWALTAGVTLISWRTKLHILWLIAAGGLLGVMGWV